MGDRGDLHGPAGGQAPASSGLRSGLASRVESCLPIRCAG